MEAINARSRFTYKRKHGWSYSNKAYFNKKVCWLISTAVIYILKNVDILFTMLNGGNIGMKSKKAGELIQIDHMRVGMPAACPVTGMVFLKAYTRATSLNAKVFLHYLIKSAPFEITSIQVEQLS
jgi:hypothetical protein